MLKLIPLSIFQLADYSLYHLIEAEWRIYTSAQHTNIASDNGLATNKALTHYLTNAAKLSVSPWGAYFTDTLFKLQIFSFIKNFVCQSGGPLSRPQCVNHKDSMLRIINSDLASNFVPTIQNYPLAVVAIWRGENCISPTTVTTPAAVNSGWMGYIY